MVTLDSSRRTFLKTAGLAGATALAGCTGSSSGDSITIGLQADLTGGLATYGYWHDRLLPNYVEEINADGGINGMDVELAVRDAASDPESGIQAFRSLVQRDEADFVIGAQSSATNIATPPLAKELEVPYFPIGMTPAATGSEGNRWVVRHVWETQQAASKVLDWGLENVGENWTIIYSDYAYGQSWTQELTGLMEQRGGTVLDTIAVPFTSTDVSSYLNNVPEDTDVLFSAIVGPASQNYIRQSGEMDVPGQRLGNITSIEGIEVSSLGEAGNGAKFLTSLPRNPQNPSDAVQHLQEVAQVDSSDEPLTAGYYWESYEGLSWIKDAAEAVDWTSSDDNQSFIEWFESEPSVEGGHAYPQGGKFFRKDDHQAIMNTLYLEEIQDAQLNVVEEFDIQEAGFSADVDLSAQEF